MILNWSDNFISRIKNGITHWDVFWSFVCHSSISYCFVIEWNSKRHGYLLCIKPKEMIHHMCGSFCHVSSEGRKGSCYLMLFCVFKWYSKSTKQRGNHMRKEEHDSRLLLVFGGWHRKNDADSKSLLFVAMLAFICGCRWSSCVIFGTLEVLLSVGNDWRLSDNEGDI